MRISELARQTGVPVATIKFYLREGLLPEGELTARTQAQYDERHVARLRLVRALLGPGGLSITRAREVVAAIDSPPESIFDLLGMASAAASRPAPSTGNHEHVHDLLRRWGWAVFDKDCPTHDSLAAALAALDEAGFTLPEGALETYLGHMTAIADVEVASVPTNSAADAVRHVLLGTVLVEPLLATLRQMAHQELSWRRFGDAPSPPAGLPD